MSIAQQLTEIRQNIAAAAIESGRNPEEITLIAATKTRTPEEIQAAIAAGVTVCGENRVQELTEKLEQGAYDGSALHFIGRLQSNKVKYLVGRVDCIESVDSPALLAAIDARARRMELVQPILLQVNIGREPQKGGALPEQLEMLVALAEAAPGILLNGLMCVPPATQDIAVVKENFLQMRHLFVDIIPKMVNNKSSISCLSMGMSGDYAEAIRCGATHVRVGTALFGARNMNMT